MYDSNESFWFCYDFSTLTLYANPYFRETNLADVFRTMFIFVPPSFLAYNVTFANLAFLIIQRLTTRLPNEN